MLITADEFSTSTPKNNVSSLKFVEMRFLQNYYSGSNLILYLSMFV